MKRKRIGFTLIELLVVIAILAILISLAVSIGIPGSQPESDAGTRVRAGVNQSN
jgi:prepilin-type N-terminal cleavage/methylation domain-containing protein